MNKINRIYGLEIYLSDLTKEKQKEVLEFYNEDAEENNFDICPLFILQCEEFLK